MILPSQNIMCWICSLIRVVRVCMWAIRLGYIASDIYSRYKRLKGFNVLHPMGFEALVCRQNNMHWKQGSTRP